MHSSDSSWAIFHVVGANPAMKSKLYSPLHIPELYLNLLSPSDVPILPDYDLSSEIRLLDRKSVV